MDKDSYIIELKMRIVEYRKEIERLNDLQEYTNVCLHSLLTGDMPEVADLNQTLFAMKGRKYLEAIEKLKTQEDKNDSNNVQCKSSCLEATSRNSDRH